MEGTDYYQVLKDFWVFFHNIKRYKFKMRIYGENNVSLKSEFFNYLKKDSGRELKFALFKKLGWNIQFEFNKWVDKRRVET